jgi:hypothetical protein
MKKSPTMNLHTIVFGVLWQKERCAQLPIAWFGDYKGERSKDG